ncbi:MAG: tRNA (adenosine(37)-N6)-dimethylallyltransferase MiaA [Pseudanabaenaceae cyanobacterium SKYGB_i_bin29]|nr:tRNA (adenosine(37)-N6)-dimethylallyltransferase MiaA [Pseudanabaenaceae cyanobacterium SKYG29]MDW8421923.1 tRNA (adenosine(37)-N6)-dimethylallyltransferase MiaA [Pseudanabaenaceae cyanobacterium SKYGB_i_bin29]
MKEPGLIVIFGATATGKTELAIKLAHALHVPILNADSRQVYRYFDIGTAKPTLEERQDIPHYLIDIADPDQPITIADYQKQAYALIAELHHQGITPILVGGSGFYLRSITHGVAIPPVPPQPQLRQQLDQVDTALLYQLLHQIDPPRAQVLHPHDRFRLTRALEIFYTTGQLPSQLGQVNPPPFPIYPIGLLPPDTETYRKRIRQRVVKMLDRGWLEEIRYIQHKFGDHLPLLQTLGYREMRQYLAGKIDREEAIEEIVKRTLQTAKQQKTWFKSPENLLPHTKWIGTKTDCDLLDLIHDLEDG